MNKLVVTCRLVEAATGLLRLKSLWLKRKLRRTLSLAAARRQKAEAERELAAALTPVFEREIRDIAAGLRRAGKGYKFNPRHDEQGRFAEGPGGGSGGESYVSRREESYYGQTTGGISTETHQFITDWQDSPSAVPSDGVIRELGSYVPDGPVMLYRGGKAGGKAGFRSWTYDREIAEGFMGAGEKVLKRKWYPDEVLVDFTRLPQAYRDDLEANGMGTVLREVVVAYGLSLDRMREVRGTTPVKGEALGIKAASPARLVRRGYDRERWRRRLVDAALPVIAWQMAEAAWTQLGAVGVRRKGYKFNPRHDEQGRFAEGPGGGGSGAAMVPIVRGEGGWRLADGQPLPEHLPKRIPPAWRDVTVATDPAAGLLVKGKDAKGRTQSIYSETHATQQAAKKFARVSELMEKQGQLQAELRRDMNSGDSAVRENAACLSLIQHTGIRPGGEGDTLAAKKAYGATTLEGRHVAIRGDEVRLQFVGKKGVDLDIPVADDRLKADLLRRKEKAGDDGKLYDTTDGKLRDYARSKDGGGFKPKDFRTARGTSIAVEAMKGMGKPKSDKEYKKAVREVAKRVSTALGNTPTVALQSYIDPMVFSKWRRAG